MNNELRNYYLHTMGITPWIMREHTSHTEINKLHQNVSQCKACSLHQTRTQTVFGTGNADASLMIVGEAPGFNEDVQGEPFVGRAGLLLTGMLKSIGVERADAYITNIIKCRPPQNRDPNSDEILQCSIFLRQQIEAIQPKIILAVGKHAANYLLQKDEPLYKLRDMIHQYLESKVIVSYHPAYLLRSPIDKAKAYQDLLVVKRLLLEQHEDKGIHTN